MEPASSSFHLCRTQLRSLAGSRKDGVFTYLTRLYASQTAYRSRLPWLLEIAPQPPDVVANVEQNIYNLLDKRQCYQLCP
jgi:hypothetical protein